MGYLPAGHAAAGSQVFTELRGVRLPMRVTPLPFVASTYKR
jgi:aminomethyltransferase